MTFTVNGDLEFVGASKAAGGTPRYATFWVGPWNRVENGRLPELAAHISVCKSETVLPMVTFFCAGDQNSLAFWDGTVTTSRGANLGQWWALVKAVGATIAASGVKGALVTLEPEWFDDAFAASPAKFDTAWADAAYTIKGLAPGTIIVNCPGEWAPGDKVKAAFPKMVAAADALGVQNLRCLTKDATETYLAGPSLLLNRIKDYRLTFPSKPIIVTDLGYSTFGMAEATQRQVFDQLVAQKQQFADLGVTDLFIRSLKDDPSMSASNYYGEGEKFWGLVRVEGTHKPAYDALMMLSKPAVQVPPPAPKTFTQADMDAVLAQLTQARHDRDALETALNSERLALVAVRAESAALAVKVANARAALA